MRQLSLPSCSIRFDLIRTWKAAQVKMLTRIAEKRSSCTPHSKLCIQENSSSLYRSINPASVPKNDLSGSLVTLQDQQKFTISLPVDGFATRRAKLARKSYTKRSQPLRVYMRWASGRNDAAYHAVLHMHEVLHIDGTTLDSFPFPDSGYYDQALDASEHGGWMNDHLYRYPFH